MLGYLSADVICSEKKRSIICFEKRTVFREEAKLEENCKLRGTDNVQGQISEHIFKAKWRLLSVLSFKYFSQHAFGEYHQDISRLFSHVVCLDQSRASETV